MRMNPTYDFRRQVALITGAGAAAWRQDEQPDRRY